MVLSGLLVIALSVTPVSLEVDLSKPTLDRVGQRLELTMRQRLAEDGFPLGTGAKLKLHVEELHGHFRLSARVGDQLIERDFTPTGDEWREELTFELAQRVVMLAHEAEPLAIELEAKLAERKATEQATVEAPVVEQPTEDEVPLKPPPRDDTWRIGGGVRAGVAFRFPDVDFALGFHGAMTGLTVQPMAYFGAVYSPGAGGSVIDVPLTVGLRAPIAVGPRFSLTPELLVGPKLHVFWEPGGVPRFFVDAFGSLGVLFAMQVGQLRLGLRLAGELSVARTHEVNAFTVWSRPPFGLSLQLVLERS